jgi:hypothetical protein
MKDPKTGMENSKPCFSFKLPDDYFSEDHDIFLFIVGSSGKGIPNEHLIH